MASPPFPLIPEDELRLVPEPPEFEALLAEELGPADSDLDALDQGLGVGQGFLPVTQADLAALAPDLDAANQVLPEFGVDLERPLLEQLGDSIAAGDPELQAIEQALGVELADLPRPEQPPPPPVDGGGGGGRPPGPILEPAPEIPPFPGVPIVEPRGEL